MASNPSFRTVLACHYRPCRIRAVFHFPTRLYTDSVFQPGRTYAYGQSQYPYGNFPVGCFCLSTAMRVGPGNIIGVTGAIAAGGPGALFWMWVSAFFGMATAYTESTLAQIFKEKRGKEFVGGLPFYARCLCGNKVWIGVALSLVYIVYAMMCLPAQGFNVVSSVGAMGSILSGSTIPVQSVFTTWCPLLSLYWSRSWLSGGSAVLPRSAINLFLSWR